MTSVKETMSDGVLRALNQQQVGRRGGGASLPRHVRHYGAHDVTAEAATGSVSGLGPSHAAADDGSIHDKETKKATTRSHAKSHATVPVAAAAPSPSPLSPARAAGATGRAAARTVSPVATAVSAAPAVGARRSAINASPLPAATTATTERAASASKPKWSNARATQPAPLPAAPSSLAKRSVPAPEAAAAQAQARRLGRLGPALGPNQTGAAAPGAAILGATLSLPVRPLLLPAMPAVRKQPPPAAVPRAARPPRPPSRMQAPVPAAGLGVEGAAQPAPMASREHGVRLSVVPSVVPAPQARLRASPATPKGTRTAPGAAGRPMVTLTLGARPSKPPQAAPARTSVAAAAAPALRALAPAADLPLAPASSAGPGTRTSSPPPSARQPDPDPAIWGALLPEVVLHALAHLPPNEVACVSRLVNKAAAAHFLAAGANVGHIAQPVPVAAFAAYWGGDAAGSVTTSIVPSAGGRGSAATAAVIAGAGSSGSASGTAGGGVMPPPLCRLSRNSRLKLMCLTAASGVIANMQLLLRHVGLPLTTPVLAAAAGALAAVGMAQVQRQREMVTWLRARGCEWDDSVMAAPVVTSSIGGGGGGGCITAEACVFLHAAGCPWFDGQVTDLAVKAGDMDLLRALLAAGCPAPDNLLSISRRYGCHEAVEEELARRGLKKQIRPLAELLSALQWSDMNAVRRQYSAVVRQYQATGRAREAKRKNQRTIAAAGAAGAAVAAAAARQGPAGAATAFAVAGGGSRGGNATRGREREAAVNAGEDIPFSVEWQHAMLMGVVLSPTSDWEEKMLFLIRELCFTTVAGVANTALGHGAAASIAKGHADADAAERLTWLRGHGFLAGEDAVSAAASRGKQATLRVLLTMRRATVIVAELVAEAQMWGVMAEAEVEAEVEAEALAEAAVVVPPGAEAAVAAAEGGHLEVLRELWRQGCPMGWETAAAAARAGEAGLPVLVWLEETLGQATVLNVATFAEAAKSGSLPLMKYLQGRNCPMPFHAFDGAAYAGSVENLEWLAAAGCPIGPASSTAFSPYEVAAATGDTATLRALRRLRHPFTAATFTRCAASAATRPETLLFMLGEGFPADVAVATAAAQAGGNRAAAAVLEDHAARLVLRRALRLDAVGRRRA